jgi:hypothetical protein
LGCIGKGSARTEDTLQGKKFTEEILHGNQEKGCEEEKETLTVCETKPRKRPKGFSRKASMEKHLQRGFLFHSSVASRQSLAKRVAGHFVKLSPTDFEPGCALNKWPAKSGCTARMRTLRRIIRQGIALPVLTLGRRPTTGLADD